ncbi:uncharacterized protein LOC122081912 [Macadamia integrifolia]|uniref:uncharacterized protein LOC122081912 n=1 Tax=Macadamia integrifolia TaxID=60698 RepID=UPI001C4FEAFF|nr:uncharacterized protein LOC122081912 [Macadamia integrifolia]
MSWSSSDNFFVNTKLEVFSVDLFSEPLELKQCKDVIYDGPKGDDFKRFLRSKNFRVNRQGKAIVRLQRRDDDGEFLECEYETFVLEKVVPLGPFGFQNVPLPKPKEVKVLQSLLDTTKAELAKKNDALNELQTLIDNTKAVFRQTMVAITNSMKGLFVDFGLEPPASEDPESVLMMLHNLILHKEFGDTFLIAANEILASIASMFEKRTGLSIGMETRNSTPSTPARLIKSLSTLRGFMVDSHFFIDGSIIVRDFHLMNEDDLPIIFRDSAIDVAELKQKKIGTKSIDNIDGNSIFYGYFNIPMVGMFKGVLTRVHVTLPDEIMVKLQVSKHTLNDKMFWFVYANGSTIFEKELLNHKSTDDTSTSGSIGNISSLEDTKFAPSRVLGDPTDFVGFFCRMNRIFVNEKGTYLKFDFIGGKYSGSRVFLDSTVRYYNIDGGMFRPFKLVQFDVNMPTTDIVQREVFLPVSDSIFGEKYPTWIVNEALGKDCAFTFNDFCFMGKITKATGTFRENALVHVFFEQTQHGENCYVDALATTFFVLKTEEVASWDDIDKLMAPKFV